MKNYLITLVVSRINVEFPIDRLILAMGSHPFVPPIDGSKQKGVVALRTREDADLILAETAAGKSTVVIGGGILGLEIAGALANRGAPLTILESHEFLMPRQLNAKAAAFLEKHLHSIGCSLVKQARTRSISRDGDRLRVNLEGGESVEAELVILATGVRPNTFLARKAKLEVNRGIVVDNYLRTSDEHIHAAGDVAEHNGVLYGSWSVSQYQGTIAGLNAVGQKNLFGGLPRANSVKVLGLDLFSIGQFVPVDGSYMEKDLEEGGNYYHLVFQDGKLVGAILFGDAEKSTQIKKAIEDKADFSHLLHENASIDEIMGKV